KLRKPERSFGGSARAEPDRCLLEAGRVETRPVERLPDRLLHGAREPLRIGARDEDPVAHAEDLDAAPASRDGRVARWIPSPTARPSASKTRSGWSCFMHAWWPRGQRRRPC